MDRKLQRHRADSLRQHGFLVWHISNCYLAPFVQFLQTLEVRHWSRLRNE